MLMRAPTVMTPVPPMPVTSTLKGSSREGGEGRGRLWRRASSAVGVDPAALRSLPPRIETKLGQWPFRQEKSLLQLD